jgi:serine/threonine protein kinase
MAMIIFNMKHASLMLPELLLVVLGLIIAPLTAGSDNHQFVYSGFANASLTLDGTASVTPSGLLELTNGTAMSMGHAFFPTPLSLRDSPNSTVKSFSSSFVFGIISVYDLSSHGLTFFVAPSKNLSATPVQYLGLFSGSNNGNSTNHIFAIELDTWQNSEFGDINNNHIGIDINGLRSVNSNPAGFYHDQSGTFKNLTLSSQEAMQVWVEYDRVKTRIDATLAPLGMVKPRRPAVSVIHNLSDVLTDVAYIGFSSSTGKINTRHYVLGWSFAMNRTAPPIDINMLPKLPRHHPKGRRSWVLEVVLPIATAALLLSLGTIALLLVRRHFRYAEVRDDWESEFGPHRFSYKDLFHATGGFEDRNLLGVGGFGRVYKGVLPRSRLKIAVKKVSHDSKQGMKEFIAEIVSIGRLQNRNLVQLLGYCRRKGELILVYEYMPNGSLDRYLHDGEEDNSVLGWAQRFRIIKGIASGLLYLHEEWEKVVVHRDIKASNVLLDDEMNGRLGDFGLARLYDHGADPQTTHVVGTIGYLAPELARSGNATPPTDVFAFGMFVLEVVCGQRPVNHQNTQDSQLILADWVLDKVQKGSFGDTVDARLKGRYDVGEAFLALKVGLLCSHPFADARPTMRQAMQYFDGEIQPPDLSFEVLSSMQSEGFDPYVISNPLLSTSFSTMSHVSGGR